VGGSRRLPPDSLPVLWLVILLAVLLLLMAAPRGSGQTGSTSALSLSSGSLTEAEQVLQALVTRLEERRMQLVALRETLKQADEKLLDYERTLTALEQQLQQAQDSLAKSQADLTATSTSLAELSTRFDELDRRWQEYRDEMKKQVAALERELQKARRWAVGFGVGTAVGFVVSLVLALR